jgi:hypothetical protein
LAALAVIAGLAGACLRKSPPPPPPVTKPQLPDAQRPADAHPFPDPTFLVLVWMETTPPGAAVRLLSDGHVMGWTPETIEFHQSAEPVLIRFELEGYIPVTHAVPTASDGELKVVLTPIPKKHGAANKQSKGSKEHGK